MPRSLRATPRPPPRPSRQSRCSSVAVDPDVHEHSLPPAPQASRSGSRPHACCSACIGSPTCSPASRSDGPGSRSHRSRSADACSRSVDPWRSRRRQLRPSTQSSECQKVSLRLRRDGRPSGSSTCVHPVEKTMLCGVDSFDHVGSEVAGRTGTALAIAMPRIEGRGAVSQRGEPVLGGRSSR